MKTIFSLLCSTILVATTLSCAGQENTASRQQEATALEFQRMATKTPTPLLLDVRTPEEFEKGHLQDALNIDWYDNAFSDKVNAFDRSRVVLVYCLSGKRSAAAAEKLRSMGFSEVTNLKGGIMQWRAAGLPEVGSAPVSAGMSREDFERSISGKKLFLVDFYAEWCQPCKKMKPYLEEIAVELSERVTVLRIDADANRQLCKDLGVDALPVLQIYRDGRMLWNHSGFLEKSAVVEQLNGY